MASGLRLLTYKVVSDPTEANMFTTHQIAKGFAAALMLTLIGSAPALAKPMWSDPTPIEYLQYDLTPYFNLMMGSSPTYQYWRPKSGVESSYRGLFDYAPGALVHVSPKLGPGLSVEPCLLNGQTDAVPASSSKRGDPWHLSKELPPPGKGHWTQ